MDISQLKSFVVVAEAGSYIRASDLLQIPQPTLSRQVRALEVELRASLFHRHGRGVLLTDRGKRFIEYARSILLTVDTALLSVREDEAEYSGQLVIGLTPSISRLVIPSLARQLKDRFPKAAISLTEGLSGALYERVLLGQLNFAVLLSPASSPNLDIRPLATEDFYLVGPQSDRDPAASISVQEIAALPLILPHSNQWTRPALESAAARLGLRLNIVLEVDSTFSTLELINQGIGYSIMPGSMRRLPRINDLSWQKISNMEATVSIITLLRQPRNRLVEDSILEVTNTITAVFREEKSAPIVSPSFEQQCGAAASNPFDTIAQTQNPRRVYATAAA